MTIGRWPWRLESAKKRVITYLSNLGFLKMDGAYLYYEAFNVLRSRLARLFPRSMRAIVCGGASGADLGSSSIFKNIERRVHPFNRRR